MLKEKKYYIYFLLVLISIFLFIAFDKFNSLTLDDENSSKYKNYENLESFLNNSDLPDKYKDIFKKDFVICIDGNFGNDLYISFKRDYIDAGYFDNYEFKDLVIGDIYKAYEKGCIYGGANNDIAGKKIIMIDDVGHPESKMLSKIFTADINLFDVINELEKVEHRTKEKNELLKYLYELEGNYFESNEIENEICGESCDKMTKLKIYGNVLDGNDKPLNGVKIQLLNDPKINFITDSDGYYEFNLDVFSFSHLRFKATKEGYSDSFNTISINNYKDVSWKQRENLDFYLNKYDYSYLVEKSDDKYIVERDGKKYYLFESSQSKYFVPVDGLITINGKKWDGDKFAVYLYEFTKWDKIENLTNVDTFSPVAGYVGNLMKTFGMPYIQFIDLDTNEEIFVAKSNPMILQNQIYHMKELYNNYDKIYEELTYEDMEFLVSESKRLGGFPIDYKFQIENDLLRWPAWWSLDRKKGLWENIGIRVLDVNGLIETNFYSIDI